MRQQLARTVQPPARPSAARTPHWAQLVSRREFAERVGALWGSTAGAPEPVEAAPQPQAPVPVAPAPAPGRGIPAHVIGLQRATAPVAAVMAAPAASSRLHPLDLLGSRPFAFS